MMLPRSAFWLIPPLLLFVLALMLLRPVPIDPVPWTPPPAPALTGVWAPNHRLADAELLARGQVQGPEDVDEDAEGNVYAGLADGRVVRITPGGQVTTWVNTGGRPLGLHFDAEGRLVIADAINGLLRYHPESGLETLLTEVDGVPLGFTDDLDIGSDGTVYFSDASSRWGVDDYKLDVMENRPWGRLIAWYPDGRPPRVLLGELYFANGVALSSDESYVLVNETWRYRVTRYWLKGPKAGTSDVFIDNLPGFPDGISGNRQGAFWLALYAPRNAALDAMHPHPWLKRVALNLPEALQPKPVRYGFVVALNEQGEVVTTLQDPSGAHLWEVTSVQQAGDHILTGSLHGDRIGRLPVPAEVRALSGR